MTLPVEYQQLLARIGGDPFDQAGARDRYHRPIVGDRGYQRPSTMAKALDSEANLKDFFAREAVIGVARNPDWFLPRIRQLDENRGADGWKAAMRELVDELHAAADARDRADLGSLIHALTEYSDGKPLPDDFETSTLLGNVLGRPEIAACLKSYRDELARLGLRCRPEWVEVPMFIPHYNQAGTTDRLVELPDGRVRILDIKCGSATNLPYSWLSYMLQLHSYASAECIYDPATGEKTELPERFDASHGYICHVDPDTGLTKVYEIDLRPAEFAVGLAQQVAEVRTEAKAYVKRVTEPLPNPSIIEPLEVVRGMISILDLVEGGLAWLMPRWIDAGLPKPENLTEADLPAASAILEEAMGMFAGNSITEEEYERRRAALPSDLEAGIDADGRALWNTDFRESAEKAKWVYAHLLPEYEGRAQERIAALEKHGIEIEGRDWTKKHCRETIAVHIGRECVAEAMAKEDEPADEKAAAVAERKIRQRLVRAAVAGPDAKKLAATALKDAVKQACRWSSEVRPPAGNYKADAVYDHPDLCALLIGMPEAEKLIR